MTLRRSACSAHISGIVLAIAVLALVLPQPVAAYHFFYVTSGASKLPVAWRTLPVAFTVDNTPATFQTTIQNAFNAWNNVATAQDIFGAITLSGSDFTAANYQTAGGWGSLTGDGSYEAVCDSTGTAMTLLGLSATSTTGVGPSRKEVVGGQGAVTDAFLIINCSLTESANINFLGTSVHELGHVIGLAHTATYQGGTDRLEGLAIGNAPTMYPFTLTGAQANKATLEADDIAGVSDLYPTAAFDTTYGTISGRVTRCNTDLPVSGVNVRAVSTTNTINQISRYTGYDGNANGDYRMRVPPGTYRLIIETMDLELARMAMNTAVDKDFATEYRSADAEEAACTEEIPDTGTNVTVAAGAADRGGAIELPLIANQDFKTNPVELAFVVDDTGSMGPEIGAVRTTLTNEIARLTASGKPFPNTAIVTFKDNVTVRRISRDPAVLQSVVNSLVASGGGDCPEFSNDALITAGRLLRRGGTSMLFTDADSHPTGSAAGQVSSLYTSKSMRISVLLSGSCSGSLDPATGTDASGMDPRNSRNPDAGEADEPTLPPGLGVQPSVQTYSTIVNETGGLFAAIPGIKSGTTSEVTRYVNTGTNIAVSASLPTIGLVNPGDGPIGTTIDIDITGSNTNFQSSSLISFSGTGITVNFRLVRSATSMTANITIDPSAATGFRDVTVTTLLGGGATETATGVGAFNVTTAPTSPTIVSVSPGSAGQGTTRNVTITGANTSFGATSQVFFCQFSCFGASSHDTNITVNSVTATSPTTLVANISISATATIAYRSVTVQTGSQLASENVTGPFLVTAPPLTLPALTSINPVFGVIGQTLDVAVVGVNTAFVNGTSVLSFSGTGITVNSTTVTSPTSATANITIAAGATPGFRDVFVTTSAEVAALLNGFNVLGGAPTAEPPTGLYAASVVGNEVTLRWQAPLGGLSPTQYVLEGGINVGQVLASIPTGSTYPIFTFTAPSGAFYVRMHTMSGTSKSGASNEIRIFVNNQSAAPSAPTNFTGLRNGSTVALAWRNTFTAGSPASIVLDVTGSLSTSLALGLTDSFTFVGVPGGTYTFRLRATNAAGASAQSSGVTLTFPGTCAGPPFPPTNFLAYRIGRTVFVLWDPPTSGPAPTDYILNVTGSFIGSFATPGRGMSGSVGPGSYGLNVQSRNACGTSSATAVQTVVVP